MFFFRKFDKCCDQLFFKSKPVCTKIKNELHEIWSIGRKVQKKKKINYAACSGKENKIHAVLQRIKILFKKSKGRAWHSKEIIVSFWNHPKSYVEKKNEDMCEIKGKVLFVFGNFL